MKVDIEFLIIMNKSDKVLVLGSRGLVGSAILSELKSEGFLDILSPVREELDLLDQQKVKNYFEHNRPDYVFLAAAKVGGILANNTYRADFIFENLQIQQNVFNAAFQTKTQNLLFLGSSCIYPKQSAQPILEEYLLTGALEPTNEPYAIAKIAGLKMAESFRKQYGYNWFSVMPTNLYGENDNFHPEKSHVIPGIIARMQAAIDRGDASFIAWGSGKPRREFLFVSDMAKACVHLMNYQGDRPHFLNIGTGEDIEIGELISLIAKKMNFEGKIIFDQSKPDGTMRKLLDVSKIKSLGWRPEVRLEEGLVKVIESYRKRKNMGLINS